MFNQGDIIYKIKPWVVCIVRWARDDRFGWVPREFETNHRAGDVTYQGDPTFELMKKARVRIERKQRRVRKTGNGKRERKRRTVTETKKQRTFF